MCCSPSAIRMSFSWVMPPMPEPSVRMKYRLAWIERMHRRRVRAEGCGQQLRVRLRHVVALHEGRRRQLPVHRQQARFPPLGAQRRDLPLVVPGGERLDAVAQRRGVVVEVDPRAAAPELAPHRREGEIVGAQIVFVELLGAQHEGVLAVETPAPAVERADEAASRPAALHQLHAAVAAGVVVGADGGGVDAHHDDGLVEDLVLDEVAGFGDLLEPARHLPDARPEQLGLQRVELRVVVPLLGDPVHGLDRPWHRKRCPVHFRQSAHPSSVARLLK